MSYSNSIFSYHVTCVILVPQPGVTAVKVPSPNQRTAREFPHTVTVNNFCTIVIVLILFSVPRISNIPDIIKSCTTINLIIIILYNFYANNICTNNTVFSRVGLIKLLILYSYSEYYMSYTEHDRVMLNKC